MNNSPEHAMPFYTIRTSVKDILNRFRIHWYCKLSIRAAEHYKPKLRKIHGTNSSDISGRVCIFSHYDKHGKIDPQVLNYLAELKKLNFKVIVVSTSDDLDAASIQNSKKCCEFLFLKDNFGYDFGSWKSGLDYLNLDYSKIEILLLANDSVYGPLSSLEPVFKKMQDQSYDLFGITDSLQLRYHIQSYFMAFSGAALNSSTFEHYWEEFPYLSSKLAVIWAGETGLSQIMISAGFKVGAYIQYRTVRDEHPKLVEQLEMNPRFFPGPLNLCHSLWKLLITEYRCPFIKVNLLRENPINVRDVPTWRQIIEANSDYQTSLIHNHLERFNAIESRK